MSARRAVAIVCIAIVIVAGVLPATAHIVCDALAPVEPLFNLVSSLHAVPAGDEALPPAPFIGSIPPRGPPAA